MCVPAFLSFLGWILIPNDTDFRSCLKRTFPSQGCTFPRLTRSHPMFLTARLHGTVKHVEEERFWNRARFWESV